MNIETLITLLIVSAAVAIVIRLFAGWTLAGWLLALSSRC